MPYWVAKYHNIYIAGVKRQGFSDITTYVVVVKYGLIGRATPELAYSLYFSENIKVKIH